MSVSKCCVVVSLAAVGWLAAGCGSSKKVDLGDECSLNSDCNSPLSCAFGKCHTACVQTRDCPPGQSCVMTAGGGICQLPAEALCDERTICMTGLLCAVDNRCRAVCVSDGNCSAEQKCVTGVCADPGDIGPGGGLVPANPKTDAGVDASSCPAGSETCSCYVDGTCSVGLVCASNLCVRLAGTGGAGGKGGTTGRLDSGAGGTGGSGTTACGLSRAPVGLCQFEPGGPPGCHSYVGAVGFDFTGVEFSAAMRVQSAPLTLGATTVPGDRGIIALANGSLYSVSYKGVVNLVKQDGTLSSFGQRFVIPHGLIQLFDGNILIGDAGTARSQIYSTTGTSQRYIAEPYRVWATQTSTGEIWMSANTNKDALGLRQPIFRYCSDGTLLGTLQHPAFLNAFSVIELAGGGFVVNVHGTMCSGCGGCSGPDCIRARLVFFDANLAPRVFSAAPEGMALNADGSLSHQDMDGTHGMIQLPNGMIIVASYWTSKLVRLNSDGSYVDTLTLGTACAGNGCGSAPSGLALDAKGRLLVTTGANQVSVVSFGSN